jgi:hypothetical protein
MHFTQIVRKLIDNTDGTQSWIIGLSEKRPFTVDATTVPKFGVSQVSVYIMK